MSARRFPETIIRRRETAGMRNDYGEWMPGTRSETTLRASVQPHSLEDDDMAEGSRYLDRLRVYVPEENALVAAFEDQPGDVVLLNGNEYEVEESMSWRNSHTRAVLVRQT